MIKFSLKLAAFFVLLLSSVAQAGLITSDLSEDNYVTIGELDWAWASSINVELRDGNQLYAPESHVGWRYARDVELDFFILNRDITLFEYIDIDGNTAYKHALSFWNTEIDELVTTSGFGTADTDIDNFNNGEINSRITGIPTHWNYETFYVRDIAQVPEPSTIMIFAIALIALSMRKRTAK